MRPRRDRRGGGPGHRRGKAVPVKHHPRPLVAVLVAVASLAAASLAVACSSGADTDAKATHGRAAVAEALRQEVIVAGYIALAERADELAASLHAACAGTAARAPALEAARDAWRRTQRQWSATRSYRFGPTQQLRAMPKIAYRIDPAKIEKLLGGTDPLSEDSVARLGADQRGLGAVELVIFGATAIDERRCTFALAAASAVAAAAHTVVDAWQDDPPAAEDAFIADSVNAMIFALAEVTEMGLGVLVGPNLQDAALVDGGAAHAAQQDFAAVLDSVEAMRAGGAGGGIGALLRAMSPDADRRLSQQLREASVAVAQLAVPLGQTPPAGLASTHGALRQVLVTMRTEVASLLGVTLQLGDADGDS